MCNECGKRYGNRPLSGCPDCLAPLEIVYDLLSAKGVFTRDSIAEVLPASGATHAFCPCRRASSPIYPSASRR